MKHRNPRVDEATSYEPQRKTSSMGPPDYQGLRSPKAPTERDWHRGSYSPTTGRAVKVGEAGPKSFGQIPRAGRNTTDGE
jgi:hypothetical protein